MLAYAVAVCCSRSPWLWYLIQPVLVWGVVEILLTNLPLRLKWIAANNRLAKDPTTRDERRAIENRALERTRHNYYWVSFLLLIPLNLAFAICGFVSDSQLGTGLLAACVYGLIATCVILWICFVDRHDRLLGTYYVGLVERQATYAGNPIPTEQLSAMHRDYSNFKFRHWKSIQRTLVAVGILALAHLALATKTNILQYVLVLNSGMKGNVVYFDDGQPFFSYQIWTCAPEDISIVELGIGYTPISRPTSTSFGEKIGEHYIFRWFDTSNCIVLIHDENGTSTRTVSKADARKIENLLGEFRHEAMKYYSLLEFLEYELHEAPKRSPRARPFIVSDSDKF